MLRKETVTVKVGNASKKFTVNNRRRTSQGEEFMSDDEYVAHVDEQRRNAVQTLREEAAGETRQSRLAILRIKIKEKKATTKELQEYVGLRAGL